MSRSSSTGWGNAETGGAWTISGSDEFKTSGSYGTVDLAGPGVSETASLPSAIAADQVARVDIALKALPISGTGVYSSLILRQKDGRGYRATVLIGTAGAASLSVSRIDGSADKVTALGSIYKFAQPVAAGKWYSLSFSTSGSATVRLEAKAWPAGTAEPAAQVTATDDSADRVSGVGSLQLTTYTSRSSGAAQMWYDNLLVTATDSATPPVTTTAPPTTTAAPTTAPPATTTRATTTPPAPTTTNTTAAPAPQPAGGVGSSGSAAIGSASYPVPAGAIFVSPSGSDAAAGSSSAPMKTVTAAINKASSTATIVLRAGTYHESVTITNNKVITIQNYPGEAAWFDGSSAVSNFVQSGSVWQLNGWTAEFDASASYTFGSNAGGFVNPAYPMASHPDQVWIDGVAQQQASALSGVKPGWFFVDYGSNRLYLGSNPTGHSIRASDIAKAISIRTAGSVIRGVGVRRYAPSIAHMGAVTAEKSGVTIENVVLSDNATTGISLLASNITVNRVTAIRNGMLGIHGNNADNIVFSNVQANSNNVERFNNAPVSGGLKISRTRGVTIKNSSFDNNLGPGLWLDESVYDAKIISITSSGNKGHGMSLEISAKVTVANSLISNNTGAGMKVNDTSNVRIWNNTLLNNGRPINIVQDTRRASNLSTPGHDKRQTLPDPTVTWINGPVEVRNNVISGTTDNCLLCVEDYSKAFTAEQMKVTALGNVYQRDTTSKPTWVVIWSRGAAGSSVFTSLDAFKAGTGQESSSLAVDGAEAVSADGRLTPAVAAKASTVAQVLPADIAGWAGRTTGTRQLGVIW